MNNTQKIDIIGNIIALINSEEYSATIPSLARSCNVPIPYMRRTMLAIMNNLVLRSCLLTSNESDSDEDQTLIEKYTESPSEVSKNLLSGKYDHIEFEINFNILSNSEDLLLSLSRTEYSILKSFNEGEINVRRGSLFERKTIISAIPKDIRLIQSQILTAIDNKQQLVFNYQKGDTVEQVKCYPTEIITNSNDNWVYLRTTENKLYRLDRFLQPITRKNCDSYPEYTIDPKYKYVWGSFYSQDDAPEHVVIRIEAGTANLLNKIKNDTSHRHETCKLYKDGDYYYYEDDIIGMNEFQRWLRGYGSSLVVLEPKHLRDTIVMRAQETLARYEAAKAWGKF